MPKPLEEQTPEELRAYVQTLRTEAQTNREIAERYTSSLEGLSPAQQEGFFKIMKVYAGDKKAGAELLQNVVDSVLPTTERNKPMNQPIPGFDPAQQTPVPQQTEQPPAWAQALIAQNQALVTEIEAMKQGAVEQQAIQAAAQLQGQAQAMGYVPGTPAYALLIQQADTDFTGGDINKAHEIVKAMGLAPAEQPAEGAPAAQQALSPHEAAMQAAGLAPAVAPVAPAPVAAAPAPAPAPAFPLTATATGAPPAGPTPEGPGIETATKHQKNDAALKYMEAFESASNGNFPGVAS